VIQELQGLKGRPWWLGTSGALGLKDTGAQGIQGVPQGEKGDKEIQAFKGIQGEQGFIYQQD